MLRQIELFRDYVALFQVDVFLDANVVLRELMWLSRKRKNPRGRPEVLELLECQTVRGHAPTFLVQEIESKIPKLAQQHRIPEETLRGHWERYRLRITFVDVGGPSRGRKVRDRKDTPYVRLQQKLEFPIASHDSDIAAMGGKVLRMQVFGSLKMYSRNAAVELHLKVAGIGFAVALFGLSTLFAPPGEEPLDPNRQTPQACALAGGRAGGHRPAASRIAQEDLRNDRAADGRHRRYFGICVFDPAAGSGRAPWCQGEGRFRAG